MNAFEFSVDECQVNAWLHSGERMRPGVVILPGGGYGLVSDREAEPVAEHYYNAGFHTYVARYSVGKDAVGFKPLIQIASLIARIRENSANWFTIPDKIAVCGFSAGGHLACSTGTLFNEKRFLEVAPDLGNIRPDAMILCYPVITADEFAHIGSIKNVSGARQGSEEYRWFGLDTHVDKETPPTFLWHTANDPAVPVENSLKFSCALSAHNIPFELHIFPDGRHGMSVCTRKVNSESEYVGRWVDLSIRWLNQLFDFSG